MRDLSRHSAEIERGLPGVWRGPRDGARDRLLNAADAYPQRPDAPHAQPRIRQRLCLRPRHRGRLLGPELFPGGGGAAQFLPPRRARVRAGDQQTARILGEAAPRNGSYSAMTEADETITVDSSDGSLRLDRWFKRHYPGLGHGQLEKLLRTGRIRVDGKRARSSDRVGPGQAIRLPPHELTLPPRPVRPQPRPADAAILQSAVLHRDEAVIVLGKPP